MGLPNPVARIATPDDRVLDYDRASGGDRYRLYDIVFAKRGLDDVQLREVEGMLDDKGVVLVLDGDSDGLSRHFIRSGVIGGVAFGKGPRNPEEARIESEEYRRG